MRRAKTGFLFRSICFILSLCALCNVARFGFATSLPVGGTLNPPAQVGNPFSGTEVPKASSNLPFHGTAFDGFLLSQVVQEDHSHNPLDGLTFVYTLSSNAASTNAIHRFTLTSFGSSLLD